MLSGSSETTIDDRGTAVTLHLKDEHKEFLSPGRLRTLVARYSDYVGYPIELDTFSLRIGDATETLASTGDGPSLMLTNDYPLSDGKRGEYEEWRKSHPIKHD